MLTGKVVVVTGGAGLLGREFVRAIADAGGDAVIADINPDAGARVAAQLTAGAPRGRIAAETLDITSRDSIQALIASVHKRFGKIDAVVNSAYPRTANYGRKFEEVAYADFCKALDVHLGGYFLVAQQFALFFRQQGFGNVVTLASIYGVVAPRFDIYADTSMTMPVEYAVIKSALIHLNQYMMRYFKGHDLRFNCLSPGGILDGQPASFLQRYAEYAQTKGMLIPADVTGALLFLLSDQSKFINGQNLIVDDGWTV